MVKPVSFRNQKTNTKKVGCKTLLLISFPPVLICPLRWWGSLSLEGVLRFHALQGLSTLEQELREVVDSPSLQTFEAWLDIALSNLIQSWSYPSFELQMKPYDLLMCPSILIFLLLPLAVNGKMNYWTESHTEGLAQHRTPFHLNLDVWQPSNYFFYSLVILFSQRLFW